MPDCWSSRARSAAWSPRADRSSAATSSSPAPRARCPAAAPPRSAMETRAHRRAAAATFASSPNHRMGLTGHAQACPVVRTMARLIVYYLLLFGACGYAFWRGKAEARIVATAFFVGSFATIAMHSHLRGGYSSLEKGVFVVDVA